MLPVKEIDCISVTEKLLYNIMCLLKANAQPVEPSKSVPDKCIGSIGKCPVCGKVWDNNGQRLACVRKHKKEGKPI